jgi:hypothetical protein
MSSESAMSIRFAFALAVCSSLMLAACSDSGKPASAPPVAAPAAPKGPSAEQQYALYEQMVTAGNAELAVPLGDEILKSFPDSASATRVRQNIETLRAKATSDVDTRRLTRMWAYQSGMQSGGKQNTASIYSRDEPGVKAERIRLIFRRHSEWGQSVYLFGSEPGFTCAKACRVAVRFDDQPEKRYLGSIPPTGEPAIFIEEDKAFIARLEKARIVAIDVAEKGKPKRTLVFEVGGYEPSKFLPLSGK